jgi:sialic acid synthase SpsE
MLKNSSLSITGGTGFFGHSLGIGALISTFSYGAAIIKKHFILNNYIGADSKFSSEF